MATHALLYYEAQMDLPFIREMHTPSIKPCQTEEGSYAAHTHAGGELIYAVVYCYYHQMRESKQEPGCILPLWSPSSSSESQVFIELSLCRRPSRHPSTPYLLIASLSLTLPFCFSHLLFLSFFSFLHLFAFPVMSFPPFLYMLVAFSLCPLHSFCPCFNITVVTTGFSLCSDFCLQICLFPGLTQRVSKAKLCCLNF